MVRNKFLFFKLEFKFKRQFVIKWSISMAVLLVTLDDLFTLGIMLF